MSRAPIMRGRRGLTLIELLLSIVVTALVAVAMLRTLRGTLLFSERSERGREARSIARSSLALVETDLQSVAASSTGTAAVESATATAVTVRIPIAMGTLCNTTGGTATISLLPTDSLTLADGSIAGSAYRNSTGDWVYVPGVFVPSSGLGSVCASVGVTTLAAGVGATNAPAGSVRTIGSAIPVSVTAGTLVMLYRRVRYEFANSTERPGTTGLYRQTLGATGASPTSTLEIASSFTADATFQFYTGTTRTSTATVPADLRTLRGLELILPARSPSSGRDGSGQVAQTVRTSVFFRNRTD